MISLGPSLTFSAVQVSLGLFVLVAGVTNSPFWTWPVIWAVSAEVISQAIEAIPVKGKGKGKAGARGVFTWAEVARHVTEDSAWMVIRGKVYDVTEWLDRHPGGKEHLLLACGREATDVFESYHPLNREKAALMLPGMEIGTVEGGPVMGGFPLYAEDSGFYRELRQRVAEHFARTGQDPKDPLPGIKRMAAVLALALASYWVLVHSASPAVLALACVVYGSCQALPLLHMMHDASHTAVGHSPRGWKLAGRLLMDWYAGASMTSWHNQHVVGHHIHTNVMECDPDLPVDFEGDIRRLVPRQVWRASYRWQHVYLLPLYGLLGLKFRVQDILCTFLARANGPILVNPISALLWSKQVASKLNFVVFRVALPLWAFGVPASRLLWTFLLTELVTGWYLALNFQVSHVSTAADFPEREKVAAMEWAKLQVVSSVDYSHGNDVMTFLCGALNYQTEHHLFPSISQYHYPAIAPIVMDVCKKHKVRYNLLPDFATALGQHIEHLRVMGQQEEDGKKKN
jgi:fatty acid desaturase